MSYSYSADIIDCQTCKRLGGIGFTNSEPLTIGKYYRFVSVVHNPQNNKILKITNSWGLNDAGANFSIEDKDKKDTCEETCKVLTTSQTTSVKPTAVVTPTPTPTPTPVNVGVSAIVEPNLGIVKANDLNTPSVTPSVTSSQVISDGNLENTSNYVQLAKEPNYPLYLGLVISGLIAYKIFFKK